MTSRPKLIGDFLFNTQNINTVHISKEISVLCFQESLVTLKWYCQVKAGSPNVSVGFILICWVSLTRSRSPRGLAACFVLMWAGRLMKCTESLLPSAPKNQGSCIFQHPACSEAQSRTVWHAYIADYEKNSPLGLLLVDHRTGKVSYQCSILYSGKAIYLPKWSIGSRVCNWIIRTIILKNTCAHTV